MREGGEVAIVARKRDSLEATARELAAETNRRILSLAANAINTVWRTRRDAATLSVMGWVASTTAQLLQCSLAPLQAREVVSWQRSPATIHDANTAICQKPP